MVETTSPSRETKKRHRSTSREKYVQYGNNNNHRISNTIDLNLTREHRHHRSHRDGNEKKHRHSSPKRSKSPEYIF